MKMLFMSLAMLIATQVHAWNKIIECNNGEFVVDQGDNDAMGRPTYQLVLRGQPLNYFLQQNAIDQRAVNSSGEFVIELNTYDGELMGFSFYGFASNDMQIYRNYRVSRHYGDVSLRATIGNRYLGENEKANWQFHNCR